MAHPTRIVGPGILALILITSGCADINWEMERPDPEIVASEQRQGIIDTIQGETTVNADIRNNGATGNVVLELTVFDQDRTVLNRFNRTIRIRENETRRASITFEVPQGADRYELDVFPADR